ncbi:MAG TPA: aldehyde dehydrogenase family protein [Gemmatimonadales bacterium]|nr:aldehyde dehydrogenase family protein [Gemmatimonadales bacterium]
MLKVINPATEELVTELEEDDAQRVARKAAAARAAQPAWAGTPLAERLAAVRRFGELLQSRRDSLAKTLTSEMGKPIRQSRNELTAMQGRIDFFLEYTAAAIEEEIVHLGSGPPPMEERIRYEPLGIIASISAWNYPYFVGSNVYLPALLTGNAVLYKPSEYAALSGLAVAELLHEAGVPKEIFQPIVGAGDTGRTLLSQDIDAVCFTGSYATGRKVAEAAAQRLLRVQLELGGKDPAYVCDDVDVAAAAAAVAEGVFYNAGQSCCAVERVYVHRRIAGNFVKAFIEAARALVVGDPADERTDVGPLARRAQLDVLEAQVADALAKGAQLELGGRRCAGRGYYFEPTVLTRADRRMTIMREESFGPIIGIQEVRDDSEATALMNDTEYGLTAAVYSRDRPRAERILAEVNAGSAYWNCCDRVSPRLPWSGRKNSGLGTTLSVAGIRSFVQPKAWHLRCI